MKKTDLEKYSELHEEFIRECDRVADIVKHMPLYKNDIEFEMHHRFGYQIYGRG